MMHQLPYINPYGLVTSTFKSLSLRGLQPIFDC